MNSASPSAVNPARICLRVFLVALGAGAGLGCEPPQVTTTRDTVTTTARAETAHLAKVHELLVAGDDMPEDRVLPEVLFHLSQWSDAHPLPEKWQADPLVERLPRALRQFLNAELLAQPTFEIPDISHLREALLLREVSRWAVRRPADEPLEAWIRSPASGLAASDAEQLVLATRLFDWTVRNIQLDALLPYPKDEAAGPVNQPDAAGLKREGDEAAVELPGPLRALPGPGYEREPLQTLLGGHGDAIERARLFILLARQHQLDAVVLAVFDVKISPRARPWATGVLVGDQLYLFDTFLGLPLPAADGQGIATLETVRKDQNYFAALQPDDALRYPFNAGDMDHLVAQIEASPLSLTRRMQALEAALVGEQQLTLTVRPSELADRVRKVPGVNNVGILPTCWEAVLYRVALGQVARVNPDAMSALAAEEALFRQLNPVGQGRRRHLRGMFENEDRQEGAKAFYINARLPDEVLANLASDVAVQRQLKLVRPEGMSDEAWRSRIAAAEFFYRQAKTHATYWLGLVHQEGEHPEAAIDWLKTRTLEANPPSRWRSGARYNLARCYERLGRGDEARQLYLEDDSPQRLGNLLRAQRLAGGAAGPAAKPEKDQ